MWTFAKLNGNMYYDIFMIKLSVSIWAEAQIRLYESRTPGITTGTTKRTQRGITTKTTKHQRR